MSVATSKDGKLEFLALRFANNNARHRSENRKQIND
jgi:hypothetical protein